jgi:hypothetical protein
VDEGTPGLPNVHIPGAAVMSDESIDGERCTDNPYRNWRRPEAYERCVEFAEFRSDALIKGLSISDDRYDSGRDIGHPLSANSINYLGREYWGGLKRDACLG